MKKVYKLSSPSVMRNTLVNESSNVSYNESVKYDTVEGDKKLNTLENSQNNIPQYKVITVPVHKIKILNVKKTSLPCQPSVKVPTLSSSSSTSLMYKLPSSNNSSVVVDKEVTKVSTKPISTDKIAKNVNKNQVCSKIEDDSDAQLISPSSRWLSQPRSYRGAKKDYSQRKVVRKISVSSFVDTTDGETSGMGSSVDEPVESSTESASEAPSSFLQPRQSSRPLSISPSTVKKRRGGWPKGRKRKPEPPGVKTPKAPQTAYVLFLNERRKFYKETHPNLPFVEVTKLLGAEWSSMTQSQKAVYMTRSEQDKKRYRNELQTFRQSPDYQILLRKKRIKNVINRGQTTEESSDFTDEVDDDDSEELHCRTCDQWFSSIHNKREHLYGKPHLQAITGEYQREREAEMRRRMASPTFENLHSSKPEEQTIIPEIRINNEGGEKEDKQTVLDGCSGRRDSIGVTSTTEDDRDDDDDDDGDVDDEEEEDSEYDEEGEVTEEEGSTKVSKESCGSCSFFSERVTDAAEGVINKVLNREMEIRFLRNRYEKSRRNQRQIYATLATLQNKQKLLQEKQQRLIQEEKTLMEKAESLAKISELCKNGIQLRNSERESDEKENRQLEPYSSIDSVPYAKLNRFCENSSNLLPPDSNSSSTSQEISDSSLFLGDNKKDNVVVFSGISNPANYTQLSFDLPSGEDTGRTDIVCKEISVAKEHVEGIESKSVNKIHGYQNALDPQIVSEVSETKVEVKEEVINELERHSNPLQRVSMECEIDHSYSKLSSTTSFSKKKTGNCKHTWNSVLVDRNLHPDTFGGTKFKRSVHELLNPITNRIENIEVTEAPSLHSQRHLNSIYKSHDGVNLEKLNTSQSYFSPNMTPTVSKLCVKENLTSKLGETFQSIKEKPPSKIIAPKSSYISNNNRNILHVNSEDLNFNSNDPTTTTDKFYFSNETDSFEESSEEVDYFISNFIQEEIGYTNSVSKLMTISDIDLLWEDASKAQKFRCNLNTLPSLDNIFEEDDSCGNVLSETS